MLIVEILLKKYYKHRPDNMLLSQIAQSSTDHIILFELRGLKESGSIAVPIIHRIQTHIAAPRPDDVGIPLYVVIGEDDKCDSRRIYDKIQGGCAELSTAKEDRARSDLPTFEESDDCTVNATLTAGRGGQNMFTVRVQPRHKDAASATSEESTTEMPPDFEVSGPLQELYEYLRPLPLATLPDDHRFNRLSPGHPNSDHDETTTSTKLRLGDVLVCEWSEIAYKQIFKGFKNSRFDDPFDFMNGFGELAEAATDNIPLQLNDCFEEFERERIMHEDEYWDCPRCKEVCHGRKTLQLWRVPDVFVVHLGRGERDNGIRTEFVHYPLAGLEMTDRARDPKWIQEHGGEKLVYDLFAVVNYHSGLGAAPRYTAYAQNFVDEKWYHFDSTSSINGLM
jgi:hypothetical protein